jgi:hypothetical protein
MGRMIRHLLPLAIRALHYGSRSITDGMILVMHLEENRSPRLDSRRERD